MKKLTSLVLAFTMTATSGLAFAGTSEARSRDRHGYYDNRGYDNHHRRHRNNNGDAAAAAIIGLALGAIIVGSTQQRQRTTTYYYDDPYRGDSNWDHVRRCESRYRTYDRRTDTFLGRDGRRYYCNL
jgi:hypothetical protein